MEFFALRRLSQIERKENPGSIPDATNGQMYQFPGRHDDNPGSRWEYRILPSRNHRRILRIKAFKSYFGTFHFTQVSFGLESDPGTFHWAVEVLLTVEVPICLCLFRRHCHISTYAERTCQLFPASIDVITRCVRNIKFEKCAFFLNQIDYLGHVIWPGCLKLSIRTIDAIDGLEFTTTVTELQSFIDLGSMFCRFVRTVAQIAVPLNKKLQNGHSLTFDRLTDHERTALDTLKAKFVKPSVLTLPPLQGSNTVHMDAFDKHIGYVLRQSSLTKTTMH